MSLTESAYQARKIVKYGGIFLTGLFLFLFFGLGMVSAYKRAHPIKEVPNLRYGILPRIIFPEKQFEKKGFTFEFPNDVTPKMPDQAKVYIVFRSDKSFWALEQEKINAKDLGFESEPQQISNGVYEFQNAANQKLRVNILDGSFKLSYPYANDPSLLTTGKVPSQNDAIDLAKSYLQKANKWQSDFDDGERKVTFWKFENDSLKPVSAVVDANFVRVDFARKKIDTQIEIVSAEKSQSLVSVLLSGATVGEKQVVEVNYRYTNIDRESFATYPIKTIEQAMSELRAGNYFPASDAASPSIIIRKVYLAYFEPVTLTNYMQPIFVFEGDNNFSAYVPAITSQFTNKD